MTKTEKDAQIDGKISNKSHDAERPKHESLEKLFLVVETQENPKEFEFVKICKQRYLVLGRHRTDDRLLGKRPSLLAAWANSVKKTLIVRYENPLKNYANDQICTARFIQNAQTKNRNKKLDD